MTMKIKIKIKIKLDITKIKKYQLKTLNRNKYIKNKKT